MTLALSLNRLASGAVLLQVNLTDTSHVVISAVANPSSLTDSAYANGAGVSLLSFFHGAFPGFDDVGLISSTLTTAQSPSVSYDFFAPNTIGGAEALNIYKEDGSTTQSFVTGLTSFTGSVILDLSAYSAYLPTTGGDIVSGDLNGNSGVLGQYTVISAVPEPATYAVIFGFIVLLGSTLSRRRPAA